MELIYAGATFGLAPELMVWWLTPGPFPPPTIHALTVHSLGGSAGYKVRPSALGLGVSYVYFQYLIIGLYLPLPSNLHSFFLLLDDWVATFT